MTPYYTAAHLVYRLVPRRWMRAWVHDYLRECDGTAVYHDGGDLHVVASKPVRMEYIQQGETEPSSIFLTRHDVVNLTLTGRQFGLNFFKEDGI
jgi:hypothetical protein